MTDEQKPSDTSSPVVVDAAEGSPPNEAGGDVPVHAGEDVPPQPTLVSSDGSSPARSGSTEPGSPLDFVPLTDPYAPVDDPKPVEVAPVEVPAAAPRRPVPLWRKALQIAAPLLVAALAAFLFASLKPERGYRFHASSSYGEYKADGWTGLIRSGDIIFCTSNEMNPWVTIDLGEKKTIHRVRVTNRPDYGDRALPLVVEVQEPDGTFREVGRRTKRFKQFTFDFAPVATAKLRLRVDGRSTWLHLSRVFVD